MFASAAVGVIVIRSSVFLALALAVAVLATSGLALVLSFHGSLSLKGELRSWRREPTNLTSLGSRHHSKSKKEYFFASLLSRLSRPHSRRVST